MASIGIMLAFLLAGCEQTEPVKALVDEVETQEEQQVAHLEEEEMTYSMLDLEKEWVFVDGMGLEYEMVVDYKANLNTYSEKGYYYENKRPCYDGKGYTYRHGVDVSYYQEDIDWERVREDGIEFAIIRLGYRGYGAAGTLNLDPRYEQYIQGAKDAGLDVGVYFFAQAINEQEAVEEAEFVLQHLNGRELEMPIVYDPETVLEDGARTTGVSREQFTKNAIAFCERIKEAGYQPMIYCNMLWQAFELDMSELTEYPIWYADYEPYPQTPYHFEIWQFTQKGSVDGIKGNVDINLQLIESEK